MYSTPEWMRQDVTEPLGAFGQGLPVLPFIDDKGRPNVLIQHGIEDVGVVDPRSHQRVSEGEDSIDDWFRVHTKGLEVAARNIPSQTETRTSPSRPGGTSTTISFGFWLRIDTGARYSRTALPAGSAVVRPPTGFVERHDPPRSHDGVRCDLCKRCIRSGLRAR